MNEKTLEQAKDIIHTGQKTKPSCLKCGHLKICAIYRAVAPLLGNWEEKDRPFQAEDLSQVCSEYAEQFIAVRQQHTEDGR